MGQSFPELTKKRLAGPINANDIAAAILYGCFAVYLYGSPNGVSKARIFYAFNAISAAWGAYFLSKRWVNNWTPSLLAGAVYGFSPFILSFAAFHPLAGLSIIMVPWLLLPSVYWHRGKSPDAIRFCVRALLTLLPFAGIILLFWTLAQQWAVPAFPIPKHLGMTVNDFTNLILPLHNSGSVVVFGLYHGAFIFVVMGVFVYIKLQRIALLIPIAAGLILSFWEPVFQVSPIVWAAFPILFLSVLCGLGFQALSYAGKADTKWVVICASAASVLAGFSAGIMITPFAGRVFELTAILYGLTAAALWILLALIRHNLRWPWFKWAILTTAVTVDLFYSARWIVDKL